MGTTTLSTIAHLKSIQRMLSRDTRRRTSAWDGNTLQFTHPGGDDAEWAAAKAAVEAGDPAIPSAMSQSEFDLAVKKATGPAKFFISHSGRVYLYGTDNRWITPYDDIYGPAYYQHAESGGAGTDPILEWEHMGEYVRAGTVVHDLAIYGRITDAASLEDIEIAVYYIEPGFPDRWDGDATTGIDSDGEILNTVLWRGFWKAGTAGTGTALSAYSGPVTDQIRRTLDLDFTVPNDGQLRIYYKPHSVDPRPDTETDYFYQTHSWCMSYA